MNCCMEVFWNVFIACFLMAEKFTCRMSTACIGRQYIGAYLLKNQKSKSIVHKRRQHTL